MSAMSNRSRVFTACVAVAASVVTGAVTYSISMASASTSEPEVVLKAAPNGRGTDCGPSPDLDWYLSRGEMLPDLVSFKSGGLVRGDQDPCGGDGGDSPCATDPFAGVDGLGDTYVTGSISGNTQGTLRPTSGWDDLSVVFGELGGVGFLGFAGTFGCMTLTASLGSYVSDTATNVIYSFNMNTLASSIFINGDPVVTASGNTITDNPTFPDLDISGPTSVNADFNSVVFTLRWFPQGLMSGSPTVYTFASS